MLVDDDAATNWLNEELIEDLEMANNVVIATNGEEALDYFNSIGDKNKASDFIRPNLVFLDINMPLMDGFEFLEKYEKLDPSLHAEVVIMFLTTSDSLSDKERANRKLVKGFIEKPLKRDKLIEIWENYFL